MSTPGSRKPRRQLKPRAFRVVLVVNQRRRVFTTMAASWYDAFLNLADNFGAPCVASIRPDYL